MSAATAPKPPASRKRTSTTKPQGEPATEASPVADDNLPYRFGVVPLKHMIVDAYQRPLTNFVDKIEANFDPALVGTLALSERSKTQYAVIDGQTRAEGMRRVGLKEAPAIIYTGLSQAQEAALFAKFQTERRGMMSADRFKAQVYAGEPRAMAINQIVEDLGFKIDHRADANNIKAVAALEYVYQGAQTGRRAKTSEHPELLAAVLETVRAAWPRLPDTAKGATMVRGLGFFLAYEPRGLWVGFRQDVDLDRLAKKLSKVTPSDLAKRADALREGRGMSGNSPAYMAEAIESQYRKR